MYHILLLTDNPDFPVAVEQLRCPPVVDFEYLILDNYADIAFHASMNNYQQIRDTCSGKDIVLFQIRGNKAIYVMDSLLAEKEISGCYFFIIDSPLIGFYPRPGEESFVNRAIRRKLKRQVLSYSFIRPVTPYFISKRILNAVNTTKYDFGLLPEYKVFNWLFAGIEKSVFHDDILYFLPETTLKRSRELQLTQKRKSNFVFAITRFKLLRNNNVYRKWLLKEALLNFFRHAESLEHKVLIPHSNVDD